MQQSEAQGRRRVDDSTATPRPEPADPTETARLFLPGWGATAGLYRGGLPPEWKALELPAFRATRGNLGAYRRHLRVELERRPRPAILGGHSMGAALAILAAAEEHECVEELILLSPSGLPLAKRLQASALTFVGQVMRRRYPPRELARSLADIALAPRAALLLARAVHDLDLTPELERIRARGIPCTVVACAEDRLATPAHCRRLATLLDAEYRELHARDGHIWPITEPERLRAELAARRGSNVARQARASDRRRG